MLAEHDVAQERHGHDDQDDTAAHRPLDLSGAFSCGDVCARRASSSASAAAVERTPETPELPPKPLMPEMLDPEPDPGPVPAVLRTLGSDGIDGNELEWTPLPPTSSRCHCRQGWSRRCAHESCGRRRWA